MYYTILIILFSSCTFAVCQERVDSGLLVRDAGRLRAHIASWTILVVLDQPEGENELLEVVQYFRSVIDTRAAHISQDTRNTWKHRLDWIVARGNNSRNSDYTHNRQRRGIFDFIGEISHTLFGTATEAQIQDLTLLVSESIHSTNTVVHSFNHLITMVNNSRDIIEDNQQHIETLNQNLMNIRVEFVAERRALKADLLRYRTKQRIDEALNALEQQSYYLDRDRDLYHRRKSALEFGHLTEEILPPADLQNIIKSASSLVKSKLSVDLENIPYQWFYENLKIDPLWDHVNDLRLVFKAVIPLASTIPYLSYKMKSWPYPITKNVMLEFDVEPLIGVNTKLGTIFAPRTCEGHNPMVCRTGPIYSDNKFQCEQGILNGDDNLRDSCNVKRSAFNKSLITEINPGRYVISSPGETYLRRCLGERELVLNIDMGVTIMTVPASCKFMGSGWTLYGLEMGYLNISIVDQHVQISPLNLKFNDTPILQDFKSFPEWTELKELKNFDIKPIDDINDWTNDISWKTTTHVPWLLIALLISIIIVCAILYGVRGKIKQACSNRKVKKVTEVENIELNEMKGTMTHSGTKVDSHEPTVSKADIKEALVTLVKESNDK